MIEARSKIIHPCLRVSPPLELTINTIGLDSHINLMLIFNYCEKIIAIYKVILFWQIIYFNI